MKDIHLREMPQPLDRMTHSWLKRLATGGFFVVTLSAGPIHRARAETRTDLKTLYYEEDGDRMRIIAPTILSEKEFSSGWTIKAEGIYNAISGASPTGLPPMRDVTRFETVIIPGTPIPASPGPAPVVKSPSSNPQPLPRDEDDEEDEHEEEEDARVLGGRISLLSQPGRYHAVAAATPSSQPAPAPAPSSSQSGGSGGNGGSGGGYRPATTQTVATTTSEIDPRGKVPKATVEDERVGLSFEIGKRFRQHALSAQVAYSSESDYTSLGLALRDAIDFQHRTRTLTLGIAASRDTIDAVTMPDEEDKTTADILIGLVQVINKRTLLTLNLTAGTTRGYLNDPYKQVLLNGSPTPEQRPDNKDRQIFFCSLARHVDRLKGSAEIGYRFYQDGFGVVAHTTQLAWYQKLGQQLVLRPAVRYYQQGPADFYAVSFEGSPEYYSSDYRLSELESWGYGLKVVWSPTERLAFDLAVERYEMSGRDDITPADAYPRASVVMAGVRLWL